MRGIVGFSRQVWVAPIYDVVSWAIAVLFASFLRYQVASTMTVHWRDVLIGIGVCVISQLLVGAIFIYRHRWRIGSFEEVVTVAAVVIPVGAILGIVSAVFIRSGVSYGAVVAATLCALVLALGGRAIYRFVTVAPGTRSSDISSH